MNTHKNARLTARGRALLISRVVDHQCRVRDVAAGSGISIRTVYKWLARWRSEGVLGLVDRSSRPHRCPRQLSRRYRDAINRLRHRRWSSLRIARHLRLPVPTVVVTQRRLGLNRLSRLDPKPLVIRYERERPGELVHFDVKKLARIGGRIGHRIHGDPRARVRGSGWDYVHVAIDDATRLAYAAIFPDESKVSATAFLDRAYRWFAQRGVRMAGIMSDNGNCYRSFLFRRLRLALGTQTHIFTRPYTPRTNGKAERFIQTLQREWAYAKPYRHNLTRARDLKPYLTYYNVERPHTALLDLTPAQRLAAIR